jgi:methyl-accepting chemotaxis protein
MTMNLGNYSISAKIIGIVILLSFVSAGIAGLGVMDMATMHHAVQEVEESGNESLLGARARQNALVLSRSEFRVAADPSEENIKAVKKIVAETRAKQQKQLDRVRNVDKIITGFEKEIEAIVGAVSSAATELQSTAEKTSKQSNVVAAASEQATANVQTVASATEELSASVREIQSSVANSNGMVGRAADQAQATDGKVKDLAAASQKIGDVISLINDIAAQTNLLALNATIEAARNVNEAATGTKEVSTNIVSVSAAAQHTGASATQVLSAAGELAKNGEKLRTQVGAFLRDVRAA